MYFFGGLECVGRSFAYIAHFVFLRDVWIRKKRAAAATRRAANLARAHIFKLFWSPGIDSKELTLPACSVAGRYDNPILLRFLAPTDCLKIPAQASPFSCTVTIMPKLVFSTSRQSSNHWERLYEPPAGCWSRCSLCWGSTSCHRSPRPCQSSPQRASCPCTRTAHPEYKSECKPYPAGPCLLCVI